MFGNKLRSLHTAQQLISITSDIAGNNFISYDPAFRINDKAASFGQAVSFDHHIEISCQSPGRVSGRLHEQ